MSGKAAAKRPARQKTALQRAKEVADSASLEEGNHWFAVSTQWWEDFQACEQPEDAPAVGNEALIDAELSSEARKVAVLKPRLEEGHDFVFVPEAAWDVIATDLTFDWEIRREVIYQRSQQELQIESYPLVFKFSCWPSDATEEEEVADDAGQAVIALGSRAHPLGQVLSEVWLAAPEDFRRRFPELLSAIDAATTSSTSPSAAQVRVCYRTRRPADGEAVWTPIERMLKRPRPPVKTRTRSKKRQARADDDEVSEPSEDDGDQSEAEGDEELKGLDDVVNTKLGDLRLDNRSEVESGAARVHELLVEQRAQDGGEMSWPSQGRELQWRMSLAKGDLLDAFDTSRNWYEARVLAARRNKVHVHYRGWESKWDEWIPRTSPRLAPPYAKVPKWRSALQEHAVVQVGIQVPKRCHTKWRNATVLEVEPSKDAQQGDGDGVGLRVHVKVDHDDMWLPAHDDLLCRSNTHGESKPLTEEERRLLSNDDRVEEGAEDAENEDEQEEGENEEVEADDEGLAGHDGSSSPPLRPRRGAFAIQPSRLEDFRGPARDLSPSFRRVQDQGSSSAGRTPAPSQSDGPNRAQDSGDVTSLGSVSPAALPASTNFQARWTQVSNDLGALKTSWDLLGESLAGFVHAQVADHAED